MPASFLGSIRFRHLWHSGTPRTTTRFGISGSGSPSTWKQRACGFSASQTLPIVATRRFESSWSPQNDQERSSLKPAVERDHVASRETVDVLATCPERLPRQRPWEITARFSGRSARRTAGRAHTNAFDFGTMQSLCITRRRHRMTSRYEQLMIWVSPEMKRELRKVKDRDGINVSEQVRRAIRSWLEIRAGSDTADENGGVR